MNEENERSGRQGQLLHNGIALPTDWPPRVKALTRVPMRVPYLESPPDIIPVDVGRQLFVDDFLIAETTLERTYHRATFYPGNPVVTYDHLSDRFFLSVWIVYGFNFDSEVEVTVTVEVGRHQRVGVPTHHHGARRAEATVPDAKKEFSHAAVR